MFTIIDNFIFHKFAVEKWNWLFYELKSRIYSFVGSPEGKDADRKYEQRQHDVGGQLDLRKKNNSLDAYE